MTFFTFIRKLPHEFRNIIYVRDGRHFVYKYMSIVLIFQMGSTLKLLGNCLLIFKV